MRNVDIYIQRLILLFTGHLGSIEISKNDLEFKLFELGIMQVSVYNP